MSVIPSSGIAWGFTASDVLSNAVSLYSSVSAFVILILAIMFAPRLIRFIKGVLGKA